MDYRLNKNTPFKENIFAALKDSFFITYNYVNIS